MDKPSLKGVIAGRTKICKLDSANQKLYYRGVDVETLAGRVPFEEVAYLLLPTGRRSMPQLFEFKEHVLTAFCNVSVYRWQKIISALSVHPHDTSAMDLLRQIVGIFGTYDERREAQTEELDLEIATELIGLMGYFTALVYQHKQRKTPLAIVPRQEWSLAANLLWLFRDLGLFYEDPSTLEIKIMDVLMTLYAEHEFNASSFAVRSAATVETDIYSGIIGGLNMLKGALHGGANETTAGFVGILAAKPFGEIEEMILKQVGEVLRGELEWKMPGFGHPVYKNGDSRVPILKEYVKALAIEKGDMRPYLVCEHIENIMAKAREMYPLDKFPRFTWHFPNVDFWAAPFYGLIGFPLYLNTPLFAVSRIAGWCAHWLETKHELKEKIVRPLAEYIGPKPQT